MASKMAAICGYAVRKAQRARPDDEIKLSEDERRAPRGMPRGATARSQEANARRAGKLKLYRNACEMCYTFLAKEPICSYCSFPDFSARKHSMNSDEPFAQKDAFLLHHTTIPKSPVCVVGHSPISLPRSFLVRALSAPLHCFLWALFSALRPSSMPSSCCSCFCFCF
jgi:hypothetical protein